MKLKPINVTQTPHPLSLHSAPASADGWWLCLGLGSIRLPWCSSPWPLGCPAPLRPDHNAAAAEAAPLDPSGLQSEPLSHWVKVWLLFIIMWNKMQFKRIKATKLAWYHTSLRFLLWEKMRGVLQIVPFEQRWLITLLFVCVFVYVWEQIRTLMKNGRTRFCILPSSSSVSSCV